MSDVDDAIRDELARLVRPADTGAVMAAVAARRAVTEPQRSRSWLVAAAVIALLGLVGLGFVSSQSEEPSITASAGGLDVPGFLPSVVPDGADLVSFHKFALEDWPPPAEPWGTPGRYTLSYRNLTHPAGEPSFDLEVFPGVDLDVDAALDGLGDDSEIVRVGDSTGVRVREPGSMSDRIIWQVTSGSVVRIDANGIPSQEVLAIAASVRSVDETAWAEALAGADIAPPYGFRGETALVSGNGWSITAGMYRQAFGVPSGCAVLELDEPDPDNSEAGDPSCVSPFPVPEGLRTDEVVDVRHVWVDDRLLVWGVPPARAQSLRLVYDEGTFEASLDEAGSVIRTEPIPGADTFLFAAELEVARRPSGVEVLDADGKIISSYDDRTSRELPAKPDSSVTATTSPASTSSTTNRAQNTRSVLIFLSTEANCGDVRPVERQIPDTEAVATAALQELFSGRVTEQERGAGLSGFGPETADLLRRLRVDDEIAYVDLNASHRSAIDFAGTSCGGAAFHAMIGSTLRQFATVKEVRYAFDGNPREFLEFVQGGCPDEPIPPGDPCDPRPWRQGGSD